MKIVKVDSVTFPVKDDAKSAEWYTRTLGLAEIWRMEDRHGVGFGIGDNSATLNLMRDSGTPQLVLQVERVADARRELEAKGVRFEGPTERLDYCGVREAHTPSR